MISGKKKINEDLTVRYGTVSLVLFRYRMIRCFIYLFIYLFRRESLGYIYYFASITITILLYMDGVYVYICCCIVSVCLLQPLQYQSIPLLESRILLYFFYLHVACNLAISQFYLFATALSILPPPSIHPSTYVCVWE